MYFWSLCCCCCFFLNYWASWNYFLPSFVKFCEYLSQFELSSCSFSYIYSTWGDTQGEAGTQIWVITLGPVLGHPSNQVHSSGLLDLGHHRPKPLNHLGSDMKMCSSVNERMKPCKRAAFSFTALQNNIKPFWPLALQLLSELSGNKLFSKQWDFFSSSMVQTLKTLPVKYSIFKLTTKD